MPDHLRAHRVPAAVRGREKNLRAAAAGRDSLREHALEAPCVVRRASRGGDLLTDDMPEALRRRVETALYHRIEATRTLTTRDHPALVAQDLEMATDGGLRELKDSA